MTTSNPKPTEPRARAEPVLVLRIGRGKRPGGAVPSMPSGRIRPPRPDGRGDFGATVEQGLSGRVGEGEGFRSEQKGSPRKGFLFRMSHRKAAQAILNQKV